MTFPKKGCWTHRLARNIPHDSVQQEWQHRQGHWWRSPHRYSLLATLPLLCLCHVASLPMPSLGFYIVPGCHSLSRGHKGVLLKGAWAVVMGKGYMLLSRKLAHFLGSEVTPDAMFPRWLDLSHASIMLQAQRKHLELGQSWIRQTLFTTRNAHQRNPVAPPSSMSSCCII